MIDQGRLDELKNDFGEDDLDEIIEVFLAETWEAIDALEGKVGRLSPSEMGDQFHFLKGCARNVGAFDFADLCEGLEGGSAPFDAADYAQLRREFQLVCDYLKGRGLRLSA